ncbi:MAG: response regulator [Anaerolineae bacterium]
MADTLTLLYVEDDRLSREVMELIASTMPRVKRLYVFDDSSDFKNRLHSLPEIPTIILLDIHMKPIDGFQMLTLLREDPVYSEAIVVAVTASVMNEEILKLQTSGFRGAIAKPLSIQTFPLLIDDIAAGKSIWHIG